MTHDQIRLDDLVTRDEPQARRRRRAVVLAAAAILLLAATGVFVFGRAALGNGRLAAVVEGLKSAVATRAEATIDTSKDEGTEGAAAAQNTAAGAVTAKGPRRPAAGMVSASAITLSPVVGLAPAMVTAQPAIEDAPPADVSTVIEATSVEVGDKIYSRADAAVTPPRQVYPALPAQPSTGMRREDLSVLDLIVAADGHVEHVRLGTTPRDVHEFMLVSAAKAWRFEPATVDGQPVRFLLSVAITSRY